MERVIYWIKNGFPKKLESSDIQLKPYFDRREQLTLIDGCIIMGQQIVIPEKLVESVLKILHTGHQGINKMKNLARTNVYWPKMNEQIEALVGSCRPCQETRPEKKRIQSHQWDLSFARIQLNSRGLFWSSERQSVFHHCGRVF